MVTTEEDRAREYALLDPRLLNLVGVAATEWAALEHLINDVIWAVAEVQPAYGACITAQIFNIDGRLRALLALLKLRRGSKSLLARVNRFAEDVRGPSERRNRIVHDPWMRREDGPTTKLEITANRTLRFAIRDVDLDDVKKDVDSIIDIVRAFVKIRDDIIAALPTLPEIPHEELRPIKEGPRRRS